MRAWLSLRSGRVVVVVEGHREEWTGVRRSSCQGRAAGRASAAPGRRSPERRPACARAQSDRTRATPRLAAGARARGEEGDAASDPPSLQPTAAADGIASAPGQGGCRASEGAKTCLARPRLPASVGSGRVVGVGVGGRGRVEAPAGGGGVTDRALGGAGPSVGRSVFPPRARARPRPPTHPTTTNVPPPLPPPSPLLPCQDALRRLCPCLWPPARRPVRPRPGHGRYVVPLSLSLALPRLPSSPSSDLIPAACRREEGAHRLGARGGGEILQPDRSPRRPTSGAKSERRGAASRFRSREKTRGRERGSAAARASLHMHACMHARASRVVMLAPPLPPARPTLPSARLGSPPLRLPPADPSVPPLRPLASLPQRRDQPSVRPPHPPPSFLHRA